MIRTIRLALMLVSALWLSAPPTWVGAAEISRTFDAEDGCYLRLDGPIVPGDLERFLPSLQNSPRSQRILCLNSPGGSLHEAVLIGQRLTNVGTRIEAGKQCLSACAVIFMAGRRSIDDRVAVPDRIMHATARLGFHAPALTIADGRYDSETVSQAYDVSTRAIAVLIDASSDWHFPNGRLTEMLGTPASSMTYVETIADAARWDVEVDGIGWPVKISRRSVAFACENALEQVNEIRAGQGRAEVTLLGTDVRTEFEPLDRQDIATGLRDAVQAAKLRFIAEDGGEDTLCSISFRPFASSRLGDADILRLPELVEVSAFMFYPSHMRLADAARSTTVPEDEWAIHRQVPMNCTVFRDWSIIDQEDCMAKIVARLSETLDLASRTVFARYTWPSGAVTSVEVGPGRALINSGAAEYIGDITKPGRFDDCVRNLNSGNVFCVRPYYRVRDLVY